MNKSTQRIVDMRLKKLYKLSLSTILLVVGCSGDYTLWQSDEVTPANTDTPPCVQSSAPVVPVVVPPEEPSDRFVDYRRGAADYREFGERTPQDQYILTSGAGSNMAAAIPPTIDEEVSDYETAVNDAFDKAAADAEGDEGFSGDDAVEDWLAEEGNTLKGLLSEWCERAGWRLIWNSNRNYTLAAGAMFRGRFADVASALIRNFARAKPAPMATFYKGNRVLVVETREDENAYN